MVQTIHDVALMLDRHSGHLDIQSSRAQVPHLHTDEHSLRGVCNDTEYDIAAGFRASLEHAAIRRNRLTVESSSRFKSLGPS
jgi:hypothetical protein